MTPHELAGSTASPRTTVSELRTRRTLHRAGPASTADDLAASVARRDLLERLLARFSRRNVAIMVHRYCHEMRQVEIARLMGISERAVRKALTPT